MNDTLSRSNPSDSIAAHAPVDDVGDLLEEDVVEAHGLPSPAAPSHADSPEGPTGVNEEEEEAGESASDPSSPVEEPSCPEVVPVVLPNRGDAAEDGLSDGDVRLPPLPNTFRDSSMDLKAKKRVVVL
ncbi:unnamed protein product [Mortierella alpina]